MAGIALLVGAHRSRARDQSGQGGPSLSRRWHGSDVHRALQRSGRGIDPLLLRGADLRQPSPLERLVVVACLFGATGVLFGSIWGPRPRSDDRRVRRLSHSNGLVADRRSLPPHSRARGGLRRVAGAIRWPSRDHRWRSLLCRHLAVLWKPLRDGAGSPKAHSAWSLRLADSASSSGGPPLVLARCGDGSTKPKANHGTTTRKRGRASTCKRSVTATTSTRSIPTPGGATRNTRRRSRTAKKGSLSSLPTSWKRNPVREIEIVRAFEDGQYVFLHVLQSLNHGEWQYVYGGHLRHRRRREAHRALGHHRRGAGHDCQRTVPTRRPHRADRSQRDTVQQAARAPLRERGARSRGPRPDLRSLWRLTSPNTTPTSQTVSKPSVRIRTPPRYATSRPITSSGAGTSLLCSRRGSVRASARRSSTCFASKIERFVEHWDVIEPITPRDTWVNSGKF